MKLLILLGLVLPAMSRNIGSFIIGGTNANIANFPHQLSLRYNGSHTCGASLISQTRAITAAHCVRRDHILGGATIRQVTNGPTSVHFKPTKIVLHPNYIHNASLAFPNDIAVLIFDPVEFNVNFQPIELASPSDGDFVGAKCVITGWGMTNGTDPTSAPSVLQQANMTGLTQEECRQYFANIRDGNICVGSPTSSGCMGDSGGPLTCGNKLVGATSFGDSQCRLISPSVYTRVSYFYDFIASAQ